MPFSNLVERAENLTDRTDPDKEVTTTSCIWSSSGGLKRGLPHIQYKQEMLYVMFTRCIQTETELVEGFMRFISSIKSFRSSVPSGTLKLSSYV